MSRSKQIEGHRNIQSIEFLVHLYTKNNCDFTFSYFLIPSSPEHSKEHCRGPFPEPRHSSKHDTSFSPENKISSRYFLNND